MDASPSSIATKSWVIAVLSGLNVKPDLVRQAVAVIAGVAHGQQVAFFGEKDGGRATGRRSSELIFSGVGMRAGLLILKSH
jgi:hypothetical protein